MKRFLISENIKISNKESKKTSEQLFEEGTIKKQRKTRISQNINTESFGATAAFAVTKIF